MYPAGLEAAGAASAFTPHGTRFDAPVRLELSHDGSATAVLRLDDESDTTWETRPAASIDGALVRIDVDGFSVLVPAHAVVDTDGGTEGRDGSGDELDGWVPPIDADERTDAGVGGGCGTTPSAPTGSASVTGTDYTTPLLLSVREMSVTPAPACERSTMSGGLGSPSGSVTHERQR
jgi:hypothetical protein